MTLGSCLNSPYLHPDLPELLSQLSGVRRSAGGQLSSGPSASQLQQLQMQLQLERQQAQAARQQLETARNATRGSGRANAILNTNSATANPNPSANHNTNPSPNPGPPESNTQHNAHSSQFLLSRWDCCSSPLNLFQICRHVDVYPLLCVMWRGC